MVALSPEARARLDAALKKHGLDRAPTGPVIQLSAETLEVLPIAKRLTEREIEVLLLVAKGHTNTAIGKRLWLSEETIKSHIRHILGKLEARCRAQAVAIAYEHGIFKPGDAV